MYIGGEYKERLIFFAGCKVDIEVILRLLLSN